MNDIYQTYKCAVNKMRVCTTASELRSIYFMYTDWLMISYFWGNRFSDEIYHYYSVKIRYEYDGFNQYLR